MESNVSKKYRIPYGIQELWPKIMEESPRSHIKTFMYVEFYLYAQ